MVVSKAMFDGLKRSIDVSLCVKMLDGAQDFLRIIFTFYKTPQPIKHSFTHYHLIINPIIVDCLEQTHGFRSINQLKVGVPTPVNKILAQLD